MIFKRRNILMMLFIFSLIGCKKYPEGPKFSLRTMKSRLSGDWKVTRFEVNGIDSLANLTSVKVNIGNNFNEVESKTLSYYRCTSFKAENDKYNSSLVNIALNKEALFFETNSYSNDQNFVKKHLTYQYIKIDLDTVSYRGFRILKLTNKELKLRSFKTAVIPYVIEFKKI